MAFLSIFSNKFVKHQVNASHPGCRDSAGTTLRGHKLPEYSENNTAAKRDKARDASLKWSLVCRQKE